MQIKKRILAVVLSMCLCLGTIVSTAACNNDPPQTRIDYSITVACQDEEILDGVQVQLFLHKTAATEAKSLNAEHKAVFNVKPETYNVVLSGLNGYTYPETSVTAEKPNATVQLTVTYAITYMFGECNGKAYAGSTALPPEANKKEGETFNLAAAPVWNGYTFDGWSDGAHIYEAGEAYTVPDHAVRLTALWYDWPEGQYKSSVEISAWNQNATTGGYRIEKGEYIQLTASFTGKNAATGSDWAGIVSKVYKNCDVSSVGTFYQFRPDFAVDRRNWDNWQEDNRDFNVTDTNWDENKYETLVSSADVVITVALSDDGVLTYTIELTSTEYSYKRVFSPKATTMDSALVIFGADGVSTSKATLYRPMPDGVKLSFDWGYDNLFDIKIVQENSAYTVEENAYRDGYIFLGWQVNGAGDYYKSGDTYSVGTKRVRFIAAWDVDPSTPGLAFTELADGTYSVKKGTANAETVVIPDSHNNKPVTQIGASAFENATWLKHIVLPDSITAIGGRAFQGSGLEDVYVPDSVTSIGANAFKNCEALVDVRLPNGLKTVATDAFAGSTALDFNEADGACYLGNEQNPYAVLIKAKDTSITKCDIQSGCEYIYDLAFSGCTALAEVTFPTTLRTIGGRTFKDCSSLTSVVIPDSVTGIGGMAFGGCSRLQSITLPFIGAGDQGGSTVYPLGYIFGGSSYTGGVKTSQENTVSGGGHSTSFYYIPSSLTEVTVTGGALPYGAFKNCTKITTVHLPASVTSIPQNAFSGCTKLTDVYFDGTQADWQKVTKATGNDPLGSATMHYKDDHD